MLPSQFWEEEPADVLIYIDSVMRQRQADAYNIAFITATMQGINLSNAFRGKGERALEYPTIYELYDWDDPTKKIDQFEKRKNQLRARLATRRK